MQKKLAFIILLLSSVQAHATLSIGSGFSSATSGRMVPNLNVGLNSMDHDLIFSSTGVSTKAYYHSSYSLSYYWSWPAGDFIFGKITSGFGFGGFYAIRSFQDTGGSSLSETDYAVGPAILGKWNLLDSVFMSVEAIYGIGGPGNHTGDYIGMNYRDHVNFAIGVSL